MTAEDLARLVMKHLDLQRAYGQNRTPQALQEVKDAERRLRKAARAVLYPPKRGLFDDCDAPEGPDDPGTGA